MNTELITVPFAWLDIDAFMADLPSREQLATLCPGAVLTLLITTDDEGEHVIRELSAIATHYDDHGNLWAEPMSDSQLGFLVTDRLMVCPAAVCRIDHIPPKGTTR